MIVDIETVPTEAALAAPYPEADRSPPGNYKNDDAIAKWREGDRAAWEADRIRLYSTNPRQGRVLMIGYGWPDGRVTSTLARTEADEVEVLRDFWNILRHGRQLVGFNSMGFDFPFLLTRSLVLGVRPTVKATEYLRRYVHTPHFDVRMALANWDFRATGTLPDWCAAFGIDAPPGHGSEVYAHHVAGEWDKITAHLHGDVTATGLLAHRIGHAFGVDMSEEFQLDALARGAGVRVEGLEGVSA